MSYIIGNRPTNEINNKDREHFLSLEMKEDYSFKYIPESHFKHIVKNVQRQRRKEDEERVWASFVKEQELNSLRFHRKDVDHSIQTVNDLFEENIQDVDRELKRLEEDAVPEGNKEICHHVSHIKNEKIYMEINSTRDNSSMERLQARNKVNAYSSNILLPVSQANNISAHKDSEGLKTVFRSKAKKSVSDSSFTEKKSYTNQLLRVTNQFENNSDTDSNDYKDDILYVQPDPLTMHKLLTMQRKIAELLDEISFRLSRIPLPDGDNDLKRRQQQTLEFAIRFSRNYLYNLNRLVTSIQRHIRTISARTGLKQYQRNIAFHQDMIKQKLIAAHQLLIQALNAYYKHIPNSVLKGHTTKLPDVLQVVCNLKDICDKIEISTTYFCSGDTTIASLGKHLQDKCDAILSKLQCNSESKHGFTSCKSVEPTVTIAPIPLHSKKRDHKSLSSRLSMYSMDIKESKGNQKKRSDLRRKSCIWQKENGSNTKEIKNMNSQHNSLPELLYPSPITRTSSSRDNVLIDSTKSMNYLKEDDIRTMVDGVTVESENDSNVEIHEKYKNVLNVEQQPIAMQRGTSTERVLQLKNLEQKGVNIKERNVAKEDNLIEKVTTIANEHFTTLAPVISDLVAVVSEKQTESGIQPVSEASMETLREFLQKYHVSKDPDSQAVSASDNCARSHCKLNSLPKTQKCGENVQLICISSMEKVPKIAQCDASCQADYKISAKDIHGIKTKDLSMKDGIELVVSKETELQFLEFRSEYKNLCLSRPMYSSNTQNKPWDIVAWISDKLIEELIIEITEELQMSDIIKKLFEMEFQEF